MGADIAPCGRLGPAVVGGFLAHALLDEFLLERFDLGNGDDGVVEPG
jgi:hypothetical protein